MNVFQERGITHLDLHGERHFDVDLIVLDFVLQHQNEIPLIIICGNSNQMINLVTRVDHPGVPTGRLGHRAGLKTVGGIFRRFFCGLPALPAEGARILEWVREINR